MKFINDVFFKITPKYREIFFYKETLKNPIKKIGEIRKLKDYYKKENINFGKYNYNKKEMFKDFKRLILKSKDGIEFAKEFYNSNIKIIKQTDFNNDNVILICLVKNDLIRIKEFIKHYNKLGVINYVFIDNNSTDGTFEYLKSLENITLFSIDINYSTIRRQAWITKVMSYFGYNRWFLIVDSDEFLVYNKCEQNDINKLIKIMESKNVTKLKSLMIDMYADGEFLNIENNNSNNILDSYCYFDVDTYEQERNKRFELVRGGMRKRVFYKYGNISPFLIKYPITYYQKGELQYNSHFSYPFYKNFSLDLNLALLHYKFLPNDLEKIKIRVEEKNYASGSKEYNSYLNAYKSNKKLNFKNNKSKKYSSSRDLNKIKLIKEIQW